MRVSRNSFLMFLIGLGSATKIYVVGLLSLSEIFVFAAAPFLYLKYRSELKRTGFNTLFLFVGLMMVGAILSTTFNHGWLFACLKFIAVLYSIFAFVVVFFWLLRTEFKGLNWFAFGAFLSSIVVIWFFNTTLHVDESIGSVAMEESTVEEVMSGVRFWTVRIGQLLRMPVVGELYYEIPVAFSVLLLFVSTVVSLKMSISGRSDAAGTFMALVLIAIGRKSRSRMMILGRHMVLFGAGVLLLAISGKNVYKYCAVKGFLGEAALHKYEAQTKHGDSLLRLLMAGRCELFIGIRALMDNPILGFGADAKDINGYRQEFVSKYGDIDDYEYLLAAIARNERFGYSLRIPTHAFIVEFWGKTGIVGLAFCIYWLYLIYVYFCRYAWAIPQWYGFLACAIPAVMWGMFFSPYGHGPGRPLMITCLLLARAVGQGKLHLPYEMELDARQHDK